jgi:hypothetical protein
MDDLQARLRDADPLRTEGGLSVDDADAMRRRVIEAIDHQPAANIFWPRPMLLAATVALTLVTGVVVGRRLPPPDTTMRASTSGGAATIASAGPVDRRQLQFATPGGTRIIWVFDPEFNP